MIYAGILLLAFVAQDLTIRGPQSVAPGTLVRLSVEEIPDGGAVAWVAIEPSTLDFEALEQGKRVIFAAPCRSVKTVQLVAISVSNKDGNLAITQKRYSVSIDGSESNDPAEPPIDSFESKLISVVRSVPSSAKSYLALIAGNFESASIKCRQSAYSDIQELTKDLAKMNAESIPTDYDLDVKPLFAAVQDEFKRLELKTIPDHEPLLKQIADSIRKGLQ